MTKNSIKNIFKKKVFRWKKNNPPKKKFKFPYFSENASSGQADIH